MYKQLSFLTLILALLTGCGASINSIEAYVPIPLEKSPFMPSKEELKTGKTKVVLTPINDKNFKLARRANLGQSLYIELDKELSTSGTVEVLDRDIAKKFDEEIKLSELGEESNMDELELKVAKYAISGSLSNVQFISRFTQKQIWTDKKGKKYVIPAHYNYTAAVSGILKVYSIPSMKVLKTIAFSDRISRREDSRFFGNDHRPLDTSGMINQAGRDAIHATRNAFKNFLAPKGYIMKLRQKDDEQIVQVSIGSFDGLETGSDVHIYSTISSENPLTQEIEIETIKIADGIVSDKISEHRAWIIIQERSHDIKLGDYIKAKYSKGFEDYLNDFVSSY